MTDIEILKMENAALRESHADLVKTIAELQGKIDVAMAGVWAEVFKTGPSTDLA
jgi:hypothetical protein